MPIYDKTARELFWDFVKEKNISTTDILNRTGIVAWFESNYPKIKKGTVSAHLLKLSINAPSRVHYNAKEDGSDDLFFQIDRSHFRLYDKEKDPTPIYKAGDDPDSLEDENDGNEKVTGEFAYERDLKNYLAKNLSIIETGLQLYQDGDITGVEYPVGGRFVDILAIDQNNNLVVIELRVSKGYDRVIGQLLRYMAWIENNHAEKDQRVRGVIIASNISEDLLLACSKIADVELFEYELSLNLKKVSQL